MPTRRREHNQQLFRAVNERISEIGTNFDQSIPLDFICECANTSCVDPVPLSRAEYELVPRARSYFLVKPGHEARDQRVLIRTTQYVVVDDPTLVVDSVSGECSVESADVVNLDA
jgi:hypothetical protein